MNTQIRLRCADLATRVTPDGLATVSIAREIYHFVTTADNKAPQDNPARDSAGVS